MSNITNYIPENKQDDLFWWKILEMVSRQHPIMLLTWSFVAGLILQTNDNFVWYIMIHRHTFLGSYPKVSTKRSPCIILFIFYLTFHLDKYSYQQLLEIRNSASYEEMTLSAAPMSDMWRL